MKRCSLSRPQALGHPRPRAPADKLADDARTRRARRHRRTRPCPPRPGAGPPSEPALQLLDRRRGPETAADLRAAGDVDDRAAPASDLVHEPGVGGRVQGSPVAPRIRSEERSCSGPPAPAPAAASPRIQALGLTPSTVVRSSLDRARRGGSAGPSGVPSIRQSCGAGTRRRRRSSTGAHDPADVGDPGQRLSLGAEDRRGRRRPWRPSASIPAWVSTAPFGRPGACRSCRSAASGCVGVERESMSNGSGSVADGVVPVDVAAHRPRRRRRRVGASTSTRSTAGAVGEARVGDQLHLHLLAARE